MILSTYLKAMCFGFVYISYKAILPRGKELKLLLVHVGSYMASLIDMEMWYLECLIKVVLDQCYQIHIIMVLQINQGCQNTAYHQKELAFVLRSCTRDGGEVVKNKSTKTVTVTVTVSRARPTGPVGSLART